MNFSQKLGLFILIVISVCYVYFSFFNQDGLHFNLPERSDNPPVEFSPITEENFELPSEEPPTEDKSVKQIKIFICDSKGKIRSVNRTCDTSVEKSCFEYAIKELISAPSNWEKSKGFTSEIPPETKIISIREGAGSIMVDLSSSFENGGGAESTYVRVKQIIKTAKANSNLPVYLYINGKQADVIGGEGIMIKQPLSERSLDE